MKGFSATTIVIFSVLLLVSVNTSQFAFSDGLGSPAACLTSPPDVIGSVGLDLPVGPDGTNSASFDTSSMGSTTGKIVTHVCIKTGAGSPDVFPPPFGISDHSIAFTSNGGVGTDGGGGICYTISGIGTAVATVTETFGGGGGCMGISHADFKLGPGDMVGGHGGITDNTALLVSGSHLTASWMIPLLVSAIGIGVFVFTRK